MATEYAVGDRVQAIDELGRFENGRVISIQQDKFVVKFDGYSSDYNVTTCVSRPMKNIYEVSYFIFNAFDTVISFFND